jgi:hypothetical protein
VLNPLPTFQDNVSVPSSKVKKSSKSTRRCVIPQKSADLINIATEVPVKRSVMPLEVSYKQGSLYLYRTSVPEKREVNKNTNGYVVHRVLGAMIVRWLG